MKRYTWLRWQKHVFHSTFVSLTFHVCHMMHCASKFARSICKHAHLADWDLCDFFLRVLLIRFGSRWFGKHVGLATKTTQSDEHSILYASKLCWWFGLCIRIRIWTTVGLDNLKRHVWCGLCRKSSCFFSSEHDTQMSNNMM